MLRRIHRKDCMIPSMVRCGNIYDNILAEIF